MKRFNTEQAQKTYKLHQSCVEESPCVVVGGGAI